MCLCVCDVCVCVRVCVCVCLQAAFFSSRVSAAEEACAAQQRAAEEAAAPAREAERKLQGLTKKLVSTRSYQRVHYQRLITQCQHTEFLRPPISSNHECAPLIPR